MARLRGGDTVSWCRLGAVGISFKRTSRRSSHALHSQHQPGMCRARGSAVRGHEVTPSTALEACGPGLTRTVLTCQSLAAAALSWWLRLEDLLALLSAK
jgi:hypothetical protein